MTILRFEEVSIRGLRRWKDATGKWHQETRKFWQTINPYNTNAAGEPKSREEITGELIAERGTRGSARTWRQGSMANSKKIEAGEVVTLKSGGPRMTTAERAIDPDGTFGTETWWCVWIYEGDAHAAKFPAAALAQAV